MTTLYPFLPAVTSLPHGLTSATLPPPSSWDSRPAAGSQRLIPKSPNCFEMSLTAAGLGDWRTHLSVPAPVGSQTPRCNLSPSEPPTGVGCTFVRVTPVRWDPRQENCRECLCLGVTTGSPHPQLPPRLFDDGPSARFLKRSPCQGASPVMCGCLSILRRIDELHSGGLS